MKNIPTYVLTLLFTLLLVSCTQAETKKHDHSEASQSNLKPQEKCPIRGGKIDKKVYTDYKGQRIYYCCPGCDKTFLKSPEKYLTQMHKAGVAPAKLQSECPISGDPIDIKIFAKTKAGNIYVCCKKCKSKVDASPDKYIDILNSKNVVIGSAAKISADHKDHDHSKHNH